MEDSMVCFLFFVVGPILGLIAYGVYVYRAFQKRDRELLEVPLQGLYMFLFIAAGMVWPLTLTLGVFVGIGCLISRWCRKHW